MDYAAAVARIKQARGKKPQKQAADEAGISQPVWALVEAGKKRVTPETLARMGAAVGLKIGHRPESFTVAKQAGKILEKIS